MITSIILIMIGIYLAAELGSVEHIGFIVAAIGFWKLFVK